MPKKNPKKPSTKKIPSWKTSKAHCLDGKTLLVTGGTGSFGKRFIKTVLEKYKIKRLVIYSRDELKQEEMRTREGYTDERLRYFIGDVRDRERLYRAMVDVDIVVHAAAMKQVPASEYNPIEAVRTNIHGAENIINAAIDRKIDKIIALSTDKAVNPTNLYGATKLVAEKLFVQGNNYSSADGAKFSCVRYGNVIGSRGSVIPLFLHQRQNGVITITDKRMTRFLLTLDQGVQFVINSIELMQGGEIFIPKIPSMKITDIARAIAPTSEVREIGIRPGEKLHEVMVSESESINTYEFEEMFVIRPTNLFREPKNRLWDAGTTMAYSEYASNTNKEWLKENHLLQML